MRGTVQCNQGDIRHCLLHRKEVLVRDLLLKGIAGITCMCLIKKRLSPIVFSSPSTPSKNKQPQSLMDVLLLSLVRCSFLCDGLYLCITIYMHLAAALLSTSRNGSLSIRLSGLGIIYVVLIRAVLWAMLSE